MNLGNKTLDNLISKDFNTARSAASYITDNSDAEAFLALVMKSEFLFDFIKEKIFKVSDYYFGFIFPANIFYNIYIQIS